LIHAKNARFPGKAGTTKACAGTPRNPFPVDFALFGGMTTFQQVS
jgi:hypothetical protein